MAKFRKKIDLLTHTHTKHTHSTSTHPFIKMKLYIHRDTHKNKREHI